MLTREMVERSLPSNLKSAATQELTDKINLISQDPLIAENIRDNFISYASILKDGKFKTEDYLNAVCYVSFKLMGDTNQDAWFKTFPQRYQKLLANGVSSKDISSHVAAYAKNKLVNLLYEQTMVPTYVLNQDLHQKAINRLADLMMNAHSEKVQADAANNLLTHLAKPKDTITALHLKVEESSGTTELKSLMTQLARKQIAAIEAGESTPKEIASQRVIEHEPSDG